jgi:hypothetical protein
MEVTQTPTDRRSVLRFTPQNATPALIEEGLAFLMAHSKARYGWEDIFNQALVLLGLGSMYIGVRDHYDCSDYVARYLSVIGGLPTLDTTEPHLVTPNDIYRAALAAGLLKE